MMSMIFRKNDLIRPKIDDRKIVINREKREKREKRRKKEFKEV